MSKIFLVTFDGALDTREALNQFLDTRVEVTDWHSSMTNTVFVVTDLDAAGLRDLLRSGPIRRFIVAKINPRGFNKNVSGWLPPATWEFLKRRQHAEES